MILNSTRAIVATWLIIIAAVLSLVAASWSLVDPQVYSEAFKAGSLNEFQLHASLAQDRITIPLAAVLLVAAFGYLLSDSVRAFILMLGLASYLFTAYGFYLMQGFYTDAFLLYLLSFGLSVYGLILGLCSFRRLFIPLQPLSTPLRIAIAVFLAAMLLVVAPVWIMLLLPALQAHQAGSTSTMLVFDLAIIFPAIASVIYLLFRSKPLGSVLAGIVLIKTFTICLGIGFGDFYVPASPGIYATLTAISLTLLIAYFVQVRFSEGGTRQLATRPLPLSHEL